MLKSYKFNIKEENAEYLKKCTKEGFIQFYEKYIMNEPKLLNIEYVCNEHWKDNEIKLKEKNKEHNTIIFDKVSDFHDCNSLYPGFNNTYYREINS